MGYTAPDPAQFEKMEQAYGYMAPAAAVQIVLPAFTFAGPTKNIARLVYMNQCNPGTVMKCAAHWLKLAEKYLEAAEAFKSELDSFPDDDWTGKDREAFDGKAEKIVQQFQAIAGFAMQVGIALFTIATLLAVMVPFMLAISTALMALATSYLVMKAIPGAQLAAIGVRLSAMALAVSAGSALTALDNAIGVVGKGLAAFIGVGMGASWATLAALGNKVNPADLVGPTAHSLLEGLAQLGLRNMMAPGAGFGPVSPLVGVAGAQGAQNIGLNINKDVNDGEGDHRSDWGIDPFAYDFIPGSPTGNDEEADWGGMFEDEEESSEAA